MRIRRRFFGAHLDRDQARIDMVPMIDTIFLILTVLIYGMLNMTVHRGIRVELPEAVAAQKEQKDLLTFTVTADGAIYMNKESIPRPDLHRRVSAYRSAHADDQEVYVNADRSADYGIVVEILDACRAAGLTKIALETAARP